MVEVQEVRLGSKVGGRVREVHILEGDRVEPGASLVTLDVPELEAQQAQWRAKLRSDLAALEKARNGPRREEIAAAAAEAAAAAARHERLKQGFREEEIREAKSDWLSAEADLKLAEENFGRYEALLRRNSTTQAQVDMARADFDRARGRAAAGRGALRPRHARATGPRRSPRPPRCSTRRGPTSTCSRPAPGPRTSPRLEAQAEQTRARLREAEVNLAEAVVHAPSKAVVDVVSVRKGDLVSPGQAVVRILQADDLWVKVFIPETDLGRVVLGQAVEVTVDSHPGERFRGHIAQIAHESEFTPRNIQSIDERRHQVFSAKVRVDERAACSSRAWPPRSRSRFDGKPAQPDPGRAS